MTCIHLYRKSKTRHAEKALYAKHFPEPLREFLKTVGWVGTDGDYHFAGLGKDVPWQLDMVEMTKLRLWRKDPRFKHHPVLKGVINLTGVGGLYPAVLELRPKAQGYGKVCFNERVTEYDKLGIKRGERVKEVCMPYLEWLDMLVSGSSPSRSGRRQFV